MKRLWKTLRRRAALRERIGDHWDAKIEEPGAPRRSWWHSDQVIRRINERVCGEPLPGFSSGLRSVVRDLVGDRVFRRGVSVGCGIASKELVLLREGLVEAFELYELSGSRIERGRRLARKLGLEDRISFRQEDAFARPIEAGAFDFVHWNNSLHHMLDIEGALEWSRNVLELGGLFYMDDYVGPSRFQWSEESLAFANRVRESLPERYFVDHSRTKAGEPDRFRRRLTRPDPEKLAATDPSEAADSERILGLLPEYFPGVTIRLTGGVVYHLALGNLYANFDEEDEQDAALLDVLMLLDEVATERFGSHYATAVALR